MGTNDRRRSRRLELRLPITRLGLADQDMWFLPACTANISTDGMYFHLPPEHAPHASAGSELQFELSVPPGAGYSVTGGVIRGTGSVVRSHRDDSAVAVALRFDRPLEIDFSSALSTTAQMGFV